MNGNFNDEQALAIANMSFKGTLILLNEKLEAMVYDGLISAEAAEILSAHVIGMYNTYMQSFRQSDNCIPDED